MPADAIKDLAFALSPIASIAAAGGPMKTSPASAQARAKSGVFREETVTRMNRVGACEFRGGEKRVDVEVTFLRRGRPDADGFVRLLHVQRAGVGVAEHRDGTIAEAFRRAGNPAGDLAAIGNENFAELNHELVVRF
jgi:hypothetical protein